MTRRRRRMFWIAGVLIVAVVAAVAALAITYPSVTATTCPRCYGLSEASGGVYVERSLPAAERDRVAGVVDAARVRVGEFYGGRRTDPRVLACLSDGCYRRIGGGGERGVAVLNRAVMLSPRGVDVVIAAHELSHVELHDRAGGGEVPQWFDEGLAVVVSDDARYLLPAGTADRCRTEPGGPLPVTLGQWLSSAGGDELYARAACRVSRWIAERGGPGAVLDLLERLSDGDTFQEAEAALTPR